MMKSLRVNIIFIISLLFIILFWLILGQLQNKPKQLFGEQNLTYNYYLRHNNSFVEGKIEVFQEYTGIKSLRFQGKGDFTPFIQQKILIDGKLKGRNIIYGDNIGGYYIYDDNRSVIKFYDRNSLFSSFGIFDPFYLLNNEQAISAICEIIHTSNDAIVIDCSGVESIDLPTNKISKKVTWSYLLDEELSLKEYNLTSHNLIIKIRKLEHK